ncbi:MAG: domain protein beta Propeller [Acidimicrobiales bacterium]|nr:domain protein beta Propeller [Acidimicrobiales bacterium]
MHAPPTCPSSPPGRRRGAVLTGLAISVLTAGIVLPARPAAAGPTTAIAITGRVSVAGTYEGAPEGIASHVYLDGSGRFAYFTTSSSLVDEDTNGVYDVYRRDRDNAVTTRVSVTGPSTQIEGPSVVCGVSRDGNTVAFRSTGKNLVGGTTPQVYTRNIVGEGTTIISRSTAGAAAVTGTTAGQPCPVSDNGQIVAFVSNAAMLTPGDTGNDDDVFIHQYLGGITVRASVKPDGTEAAGQSSWPSLSNTGQTVAFESSAKLVGADGNGSWDVYTRGGGTTLLASTDEAGLQLDGASRHPALSANSAYLAFDTTDPSVIADDDNGGTDVVRKQRSNNDLEVASVTNVGAVGALPSTGSTISDDGRFVGFATASANVYVGDGNGFVDAYRHDFALDRTDLASRRAGGVAAGNGPSPEPPALSSTGLVTAFPSKASDLTIGDANGLNDAFVHDFAVDIVPFDTAAAFAEQLVVDFIGPDADPAYVDQFVVAMQNGIYSPDLFLVMAANSKLFAWKRAPLVRLYWAFFRRLPDLGGLDYWNGKLVKGSKLSSVAAQFAKSSEFQTKYGALSNQAFVTKIYENIFDREPDATGLAYWTKKLDAKQKTRGDVMVSFSESTEGVRLRQPEVDTVLVWLGMMKTMPSKATFDSAVATSRESGVRTTFPAEIRHLAAYQARVAS